MVLLERNDVALCIARHRHSNTSPGKELGQERYRVALLPQASLRQRFGEFLRMTSNILVVPTYLLLIESPQVAIANSIKRLPRYHIYSA
jgi:hypothetical protein